MTRHWPRSAQWLAAGSALFLLAFPLLAAEIQMKNGVVLRGTATPLPELNVGRQKNVDSQDRIQSFPVVMVTDDLRRYFVSERQLARVDKERDPTLRGQETFELKQQKGGAQSLNFLGGILETGEWDQFGRRRLKLRANPKDLDIIQGITLITPEFVKLEAKGIQWETGLPLSSIPNDVLDRILRQATNDENPNHHLAIVRFYIQAGLYRQAQDELDKIPTKFSDLKQRAEQVGTDLAQARGRQLLEELRLRQAAGQYRLVFDALKKFPKERLEAPLLKEIAASLKTYDLLRDAGDLTRLRMGQLQAQLQSQDVASKVGVCRTEILEKLDPQNLGRLEAFLRLGGVQNLPPEDRLGLALSGWIVGSAHAENNLPLALRLWDARSLVQRFLRSENPNDRAARLAELEKLEGVTPGHIAHLLQLVPPFVDNQVIEPGKPTRVQVTPEGQSPDIHYDVMLPPEYHSDHSYPVIVALTDRGATPERELSFWAGNAAQPGQATRHGYIVIAPEFMPDNGPYDYSPERHKVVLESLRDARRRFNVDSDRVYLSGHGRGGDATFDIGLSHPDLFAGIIPISGVNDNGNKEGKGKFYRQNGKHLPIYAVSGELDRETFKNNARDFNWMMTQGYDAMICEYKGYGRDSFYAEIHKLFLWMALHRRGKVPAEVSNYTMRPEDNRFHWLELSGLPNVNHRAMKVSARVLPGANAIIVTCNVASVTLWLTPELIKLDQKLEVRINGQAKWTKPVKADVKAMLEDFRHRADRQNLYWAVLEF